MKMMKTRMILTLALCMTVGTVHAHQAAEHNGELIVKYKDSASRTRALMNTLYENARAKHVRRLSGLMSGFEVLTLDPSIKIEDAIAELERSDAVEYVQPNYILRTEPVRDIHYYRTIAKSMPAPKNSGIPCIPGFEIPNCDPNACIIPGIFPPGCSDSGGGPGRPNPGNPGRPGGSQPAVGDAPSRVEPPIPDPDLVKAYGIAKIGAPEAWESHKGDKKFVVAVIDTGIDYNHEDLAFNVWRGKKGPKGDVTGYNFVHNNEYPFDDQGHGSHCSGVIGATGGNGKGISGVNQEISIMALKFLTSRGSGTTSDAVRAIDFAVQNGAKVLSNSWGGPGESNNKALYDAIERARAKNVLFIAAAGNDGQNNDTSSRRSFPASFDNDNLIAVAATDSNDRLASFSNFGVKTTHIAAPGVNVYSTIPGNAYKAYSGTSMACPHVAGAAALIWSKKPSMNYKEVKEILLSSVDKLPELDGKVASGGRLNVAKALQAVKLNKVLSASRSKE